MKAQNICRECKNKIVVEVIGETLADRIYFKGLLEENNPYALCNICDPNSDFERVI